MEKANNAAGGAWNTRRAATALAEAGPTVTDKRAWQILRDLAAANLIAETDPNTATYTTIEQ